jgi:hypothetical protein
MSLSAHSVTAALPEELRNDHHVHVKADGARVRVLVDFGSDDLVQERALAEVMRSLGAAGFAYTPLEFMPWLVMVTGRRTGPQPAHSVRVGDTVRTGRTAFTVDSRFDDDGVVYLGGQASGQTTYKRAELFALVDEDVVVLRRREMDS